ncbi:MAG: methylated-DNA--[protein]-cysteine S-methyltransferase, partial [Acidobacteriota bacterium]
MAAGQQRGAGMGEMEFTTLETPVGRLLLAGRQGVLHRLVFPGSKTASPKTAGWRRVHAPFKEAVRQIEAYFSGRLKIFDLPLAPEGTPFQRRTWEELGKIPYGETR